MFGTRRVVHRQSGDFAPAAIAVKVMTHRNASELAAVGWRVPGRGYAMRFFWKRRQHDHDNKERPYDVEEAITTISARIRFLEVLTAEIVAELPPTKRDRILHDLKGVVRELGALPTPVYVPPGKEQQFRAGLHSAVQVLIENSESKVKR